jgi:hypothetical protein
VILDECRSLSERISEKKQLRVNVEQLKRFHKVRDLLAQHAVRLRDLMAVWRTLRTAGIGELRAAGEVANLLTAVVETREKFRAKAESLIDERTFSSVAFAESLTVLTDAVESSLRTAWQQYTTKKIPIAPAEILSVLAPAFSREVRLIREKSERLERNRLTLPKSAEQLRDFDAEAEALQRAWEQLDGGDVPAAVLAFLRATASQAGARIDLLTEEVRRWLVAKKIVQSFSIRVAN